VGESPLVPLYLGERYFVLHVVLQSGRMLYFCSTGMKKYPKYQLRVGEGLLGKLRAAGADLVREVLEREFGEDASNGSMGVTSKSTSLKGEGGGGSKVVPAGGTTNGVPAWKVKLDAQLAEAAEREARKGSSVLPGETAPAAVAAVSTPRSVVFEQSEEDRAKKMAMLTGMKLMAQMPPKTEFYPDEEPNEENT